MHPSHNSGVHLNISNSNFTSSDTISVSVSQTHIDSQVKDALQILTQHVAFGALFDSNERFDPPQCHPDTRVALLGSIDRWAQGQGDSKPILWLRGAAGAGKSAIAQTSAEHWEEMKLVLAASFFFSRTAAKRNEKTHLIPTIAYQLALHIPEIWPFMEQAILRDPGLFEKNLQTQISELIIRPLSQIGPDISLTRHVIIIDGLDECCTSFAKQSHEDQQSEILEAITFTFKQPNFPLRFFIASRPERQIRTSFTRKALESLTWSVVLDNTHNPEADIKLFLDCKFEEIRLDHPYIDPSWPTEEAVSSIVQKSSGHFVYPAVVARHLERPRRDPREALQDVLSLKGSTDKEETPFAELDALYTHILSAVSARSVPIVMRILEMLCFGRIRQNSNNERTVFYSWDYHSPTSIDKYLFLQQGQTYIHLIDLHSVLDIPPADQSRKIPIRFFHASFSEFLCDQSRSCSFYLDQHQSRIRLQLTRLKHLAIQALGVYSYKDPAWNDGGYIGNGIVIEFRDDLERPDLPPSKELAEGIAALVGEEEEGFFRLVEDLDLSHLRTGAQRDLDTIYFLCYHDSSRKTVTSYLEISGVKGVKILELMNDPEDLNRTIRVRDVKGKQSGGLEIREATTQSFEPSLEVQ